MRSKAARDVTGPTVNATHAPSPLPLASRPAQPPRVAALAVSCSLLLRHGRHTEVALDIEVRLPRRDTRDHETDSCCRHHVVFLSAPLVVILVGSSSRSWLLLPVVVTAGGREQLRPPRPRGAPVLLVLHATAPSRSTRCRQAVLNMLSVVAAESQLDQLLPLSQGPGTR